MDFLDSNNVAGQSLLQVVARGSAIVTELLRLSAQIPYEFYGPYAANPQDPQVKKLEQLMFDFRYLKAAESYDERIDRDLSLVDLDEEIRETHFVLLERYYQLFESVVKYNDDLLTWLTDLEKGAFLHLTLEHALDDRDGTQLLCEALYTAGLILYLLDLRIPGAIRERLIIAYYRYKGIHLINTMDQVIALCKDTGYIHKFYPFLNNKVVNLMDENPDQSNQNESAEHLQNDENTMTITNGNLPLHIKPQHPVGYPLEYFQRIELPEDFVQSVIHKLRTDDIYMHLSSFPAAEHQTIALSEQAAMLFICLYFKPNILQENTRQNFTICRDIMSRFFLDNYVLSFPAGITVDITTQWAMYPNMKQAILETLSKETIAERTLFQQKQVQKLIQDTDGLLVQGVLTDDYIMDNHKKVLNTVRAANYTLRWCLLHSHATHSPKLVKEFHKMLSHQDILHLLMSTASLECTLKQMIDRLITTKTTRWVYLRTEASDLTREISEVYGGTKALTRITKKNEKLQKWFLNITDEILSLDYDVTSNIIAGRTIQQLLSALTSVQDNHQVEQSMQVVQTVNDVKKLLTEMLRLSNITPKVLADLDVIGDFTYATRLINLYTPLIHQKIAQQPTVCLSLRNIFQKLSCLLNKPLVRILQAQSDDDISVAQYYSNELVCYVNRVLDVVPLTVFKLLDHISNTMDSLQSRALPLKIERRNIQSLAQLGDRYTLAKLTNNISIFTRGVLSMSSTLLGIIQLDPQDILQNGIRKHLVLQVTTALHQHLQFITKEQKLSTLQDFEHKLYQVSGKLSGLKMSFEYIQDFLNLFGLKIWQEEFSRIINLYIEQERNRFIKKKTVSWQSSYQSDMIPIPLYHSNNTVQPSSSLTQIRDNFQLYHHCSISHNFTGRVLNELLKYSVPTHYIYSPSKLCWVGNGYSNQSPLNVQSINLRTFALIQQGLSLFGLAGLDNLFSFILVKDISTIFDQYMSYTANSQQQTTNSTRNDSSTYPTLNQVDSALNRTIYQLLAQIQLTLLPTSQFPVDGMRLYQAALQRTEKIWLNSGILQRIIKVGQCGLLRKHILQELRYSAKSESPMLFNALSTLNESLLNEITHHYNDQETFNYPQNPILPELNKYLLLAGKNNPTDTIYYTTQQSSLHYISVSLFLLTLTVLPYLQWSKDHNTLIAIDKRAARELHIDGAPLVMGLVTIFKQLHSSHVHLYLQFLGQYVRTTLSLQTRMTNNTSSTNSTTESDMQGQIKEFKKIQEKQIQQQQKAGVSAHVVSSDVYTQLVPTEATRVLMFVQQFIEYSNLNKDVLKSAFPLYLLDTLVRS